MSSNCMQYNMPHHWIGMGVKGRKSSECPQVVDTADLAMVEIYPIKSHLHVVLYTLRKHDNTELFRASSKRRTIVF